MTANLPEDAVPVVVSGVDRKAQRYALAADVSALTGAARNAPTGVVRLAGSHDPYLQQRDREVLVSDRARQKELWPTLGRPGAVLVDGEVAGTWRPRTSAKTVTIQVDSWTAITARTRAVVAEEAGRLAAHRGIALGGVDIV